MKHLTKSEQRTLRLMCHLACAWEASLLDANDPGGPYKPTTEQRKTMRACQRNIKRFARLETKLLEAQ